MKPLLPLAFIPMFLFGAGCSKPMSATDTVTTTQDPIDHFLQSGPLAHTSMGGHVFESYRDIDGRPTTSTTRYVWAVIQEFYTDNGTLKEGTGQSGPIVIHLEHRGTTDVVAGYDQPRDGNLYAQDIDKLFPKNLFVKIGVFDPTSLLAKNRAAAQKFFLLK